MQFINIKELSRSPSKYVKLANEKEEVIITRNGHPYALLSKIKGDDIEDYILAKHFCLENEIETAQKEYDEGKTVNAHDLLNELKSSIDNEV